MARQLKLRDLAGLIVIDFIDMEERRNNRKVESRLKDALRHDRARIQVGRISHFGLLEMSRQRLRTGVVEGSTSQCPHCQGTGIVRSTESVALAVLRAMEDQLMRDPRSSITAVTTSDVALYILNGKRSFITGMEQRYGVSIAVEASSRMQGANFAIEKSAAPAAVPHKAAGRTAAVNMEWGFADQDGREDEAEPEEAEARTEEDADGRRPRRRRRKGRREERADAPGRGEHRRGAAEEQAATGSEDGGDDAAGELDHGEADIPGIGEQPSLAAGSDEEREDRRGRRRRRGRRGGRRGRERDAPRRNGEAAVPHEGVHHEGHADAAPAAADTGEAAGEDEAAAEGIPAHDREPEQPAVAAHQSAREAAGQLPPQPGEAAWHSSDEDRYAPPAERRRETEHVLGAEPEAAGRAAPLLGRVKPSREVPLAPPRERLQPSAGGSTMRALSKRGRES
jgi:ribonuclease E